MTTISVNIIADSINPKDNRLTTMELRYPRCIHSEFMTHRQFSRNAASSRAIPVVRMIAALRADPFVPLRWGKNQQGMQAGDECNELVDILRPYVTHDDDGVIHWKAHPFSREDAWLDAMEKAIAIAEAFNRAGYHKQIVNRLLEPFMHITVVVSSTEWSNFLALRAHKDAEPHIEILAHQMATAIRQSEPAVLQPGTWHLPYVDAEDVRLVEKMQLYTSPRPRIDPIKAALAKISAARCARTSYLTHEGRRPLPTEDIQLYERLVGSRPLHASPLEHQATPDEWYDAGRWAFPAQHGNFVGWRQFRKMHIGECQ